MINAAMAGLGWWGRTIIDSVQGKTGRVRFTRAVTKEPDEARDFAAAHGLALSTDLAEVLADESIGAVHLATPHSLHAEHIAAVAAAGKHVLCEKPLCLARADAQAAVAACAKAGVVLGVGQNRRFWQPVAEIKRLVNTGALGTIMMVEGNYSHDVLAELAPGNWRLDPNEAPAAGMTGMGIHLVDAYVHLLGPVAKVTVDCADRLLGRTVGDTVLILFEFENGARAYLGSTVATAHLWRLHVLGSKGWAETRGEHDLTVSMRGAEPQSTVFGERDSVLAQWLAFIDAIDGVAPYPIGPGQMVATVAAMEAIFQSAKTGKPVTLKPAYSV